MNEQLQQSMSEIIEVIKTSKDFATEQLPIVAQEYLALCWWSAVLGLVLAGILLVLTIFTGYCCGKIDAEHGAPLAFLLLGLMLATLVVGGSNLYDLAKVTIAPRVVVLEKLEQLLK